MPRKQTYRTESTSVQPYSAQPISGAANAANAATAMAHQQLMLTLAQYTEPPVTELCLSPLLWSESFGLRLDG
jgi:hypothetical protein